MSPLTVNEDAVMSMQTDIDLGLKWWSDITLAITERLLRLAPSPHTLGRLVRPPQPLIQGLEILGHWEKIGCNWVPSISLPFLILATVTPKRG